jgi:phenylacetate-CoA ligase
VAPGKPGRVVVTNLNNFAMPLIRYEIGDVAVASQQVCTCGRGLPLLESVLGRTSDFITSPSGKLIYGEFFTHLFYKIQGVYQFRVIQETTADLTVQIASGPDFDQQAALKYIEDAIHEHGDPAFRVRFELADQLPASSSGKYRFTLSKVPLHL